MKMSGNTILITGGATGIGFGLAEALAKSGNQVLICGRRPDRLEQARQKLPGLVTKVCDVSKESDRQSLFNWATSTYPDLNILVNNAGIQRRIDFTKGLADLVNDQEIAINFEAPILLSALFIPHLLKKKDPALMFVSSGLAFIPLAFMPLYCATKAGIHSLCISMRHQLSKTPIKLYEIIPPMVDTDLDGGARPAGAPRGISVAEMTAATMKGLERNGFENRSWKLCGLAQSLHDQL